MVLGWTAAGQIVLNRIRQLVRSGETGTELGHVRGRFSNGFRHFRVKVVH
jgi:hypothetical protein